MGLWSLVPAISEEIVLLYAPAFHSQGKGVDNDMSV